MSRSSPCMGGRPCSLAKLRMSSKPAMTRSSFGERPPLCLLSTATPSASSSSSSFISSTVGLGSAAREERDAFRHALFPGVLRGDRGNASAFLLEFQGALRQFARFLDRHAHLAGCDDRGDLLERLLAYRFRQNRVGGLERVDAVDEVDVEVAHVHDVSADAVDERGIALIFACLV